MHLAGCEIKSFEDWPGKERLDVEKNIKILYFYLGVLEGKNIICTPIGTSLLKDNASVWGNCWPYQVVKDWRGQISNLGVSKVDWFFLRIK